MNAKLNISNSCSFVQKFPAARAERREVKLHFHSQLFTCGTIFILSYSHGIAYVLLAIFNTILFYRPRQFMLCCNFIWNSFSVISWNWDIFTGLQYNSIEDQAIALSSILCTINEELDKSSRNVSWNLKFLSFI